MSSGLSFSRSCGKLVFMLSRLPSNISLIHISAIKSSHSGVNCIGLCDLAIVDGFTTHSILINVSFIKFDLSDNNNILLSIS